MRALTLPAAVYLAVTVIAPGLNGGFAKGEFWIHAAWVLACCAGIVTILGVVMSAGHRAHLRSPSSAGGAGQRPTDAVRRGSGPDARPTGRIASPESAL